jgi:hypothetical protein
MENHFAQQIESLERRLQELNLQLMESGKDIKDRNDIESEIRAVDVLLSRYRAVLADRELDFAPDET